MKHPRLIFAKIDWDAALTAIEKIASLKADAPKVASAPADEKSDQATFEIPDALTRLNRVTAERLAGITASPIPVLMPFDTEGYLRDRAAGPVAATDAEKYFFGFRAPKLFVTGAAGFDAAFTLRPKDVPALASLVETKDEAEIQITGAAFLYAADDAKGGWVKQTNGLEAEFPGLRRIYLESRMRYIFERYGVTYAVSIICFDGRSRRNWITCKDADPIAVHFLKSLRIAGGAPRPSVEPAPPPPIERPAEPSKTFSYYTTGQLIRGTGYRKNTGDDDATVFAAIRFPLANGPAHTYSQMYLNPNDCTPQIAGTLPARRRGEILRCPSSEKTAEPTAEKPDTEKIVTLAPQFPWRDNFCEMRDFSVGQCPGGFGHQGEDIVPAGCHVEGDPAQRCDPSRLTVVAVHDGTILRSPKQESLVIVVNDENRHLRFRYLHMHPKAIDEDGFLSGRMVRAGDTVGKVSNYSGGEAGTSYHVHFDMQAFTRDGWVLVNPYMTLVSAYERLLGERGVELKDLSAGLPAVELTHPALVGRGYVRPQVKQWRNVRYRAYRYRRAHRN